MNSKDQQERIEGVPEWFDLSLYRDDWSIEEWSCQISARREFYDAGKFLQVDRQKLSELIPEWLTGICKDDEIRELFGQLREKTLETLTQQELNEKLLKKVPPFSFPKYVESPKYAGIFTLLPSIQSNPNKLLIEIDLRRSDADLKAAFKDFIREYRAKFPLPEESVKDPKTLIEKWHRLKLLPAFDLLLWREQCNRKKKTPTKIDIVATLHKEKKGTFEHGQHMKKVIEPAIEKMMLSETVDALIEFSARPS